MVASVSWSRREATSRRRPVARVELNDVEAPTLEMLVWEGKYNA